MILTNCLCPVEVECNCGTLSFDYYNSEATSVLEVGELVASGECELEGYVIDWYVDSELVLTTGVGDDPDIQAFHPFTGDAAIPVVGGTYVPVIRYIIVDGEIIYTSPRYCRKWCAVTIDLPEGIVVERINCGSSNTTGLYQYRIQYISTDPLSLPSRTIAIDLPEDLSTKYMAFQFTGYDIADKIEIYFNGDTLLTAWIIGNDCTNQIVTLPYSRDITSGFRFVIELPEYEFGDYIQVVITPAVIAHIPQTNWLFYYKCLDNSKGFDCDFLKDANLREYDIEDWSFTFNEETCQREFRIAMTNPALAITSSSNPNYWFYAYGGVQMGTYNGNVGYSTTNAVGGTNLSHNKAAISAHYLISGYSTMAETYGNVNLTKSGNTYTWTFADSRDWQAAKDNYDYSKTTSWWTTRSLSSSDIEYYRWWYWRWRSRPENCGDTVYSLISLYFHHTSSIVFSDSGGVCTLVITPVSVTNEWSDESCNTAVSLINSYINNANSTISRADFNQDTLCMENKMFGYGYGYSGVNPYVAKTYYTGYAYSHFGITTPCNPITEECTSTTGYSRFFAWFFGVIINLEKDPETGDFPRDSSGEYEDEPCENFSAYWVLDENYCLSWANRTLILTVENGVVTYELPYEDLVTLLYS